MPTSQQLANEFNKKNIYEIDYEYLHDRIEDVMNRTARRDLDSKLKTTVAEILLEEAIDYESFRRKNIVSAKNGKLHWELTEQVAQISNEMDFLLGFIKIANECVKEITPNYKPPFMFGMTQKEVKNIFKKQFGSYTRRDEARHDLLNISGIQSWRTDLGYLKIVGIDGKVREGEKAAELVKSNIKEVYIRKEIVKQELKDMVFWRRWFSRRAREMKAYVKDAEKALEDAKFSKDDEREAIEEYKGPAVREEDFKFTDRAVDLYYLENIKNSFFEIGYRPSHERDQFNEHVKASKAIKELLDKDALPDDVKDVVKMNFKKLGALSDVMKGKSNASGPEMDQEFSSMERAMAEKYKDYAPLTMDEIESIAEPDPAKVPEKEHVAINLDEKTNTVVEPIKANEKSLSKEDNLVK